jgi:hypothetical protein
VERLGITSARARTGSAGDAIAMVAAVPGFLYGERERKEVMCSDRQYA